MMELRRFIDFDDSSTTSSVSHRPLFGYHDALMLYASSSATSALPAAAFQHQQENASSPIENLTQSLFDDSSSISLQQEPVIPLKDHIGRNLHRIQKQQRSTGSNQDETTTGEVEFIDSFGNDPFDGHEQLLYCHIPTLLRYSNIQGNTMVGDFMGGSVGSGDTVGGGNVGAIAYGASAAILMGLHHANTGQGYVAPALDGLNKRCPIRFTTELLDKGGSGLDAVTALTSMVTRNPSTSNDNNHEEGGSHHQQPCALIGAHVSSASSKLASLAAVFDLPVVSSSAMSTTLNDSEQYPTFIRTHTDVGGFGQMAVSFLQNNFVGINKFAMIFSNDEYGLGFANSVLTATNDQNMECIGGGVSYQVNDGNGQILSEEEIRIALQAIKDTGCNYIIGSFYSGSLASIMGIAAELNIAGPDSGKVWLISGTADIAPYVLGGALQLPKNSLAAYALQGNGMYFCEGGVPGLGGSYDLFSHKWNELATNMEGLKYINSKQPLIKKKTTNEDEEENEDEERIKYPPGLFMKKPHHVVTFSYDAAVGLALSACDAWEEQQQQYYNNATTGGGGGDRRNRHHQRQLRGHRTLTHPEEDYGQNNNNNNNVFTGTQHHNVLSKSIYYGASGKVQFRDDSPTRTAESSYFVMANLRQVDHNTTHIKFMGSPIVNFFNTSSLEWKNLGSKEFVFPDNTTTPPIEMVPTTTTDDANDDDEDNYNLAVLIPSIIVPTILVLLLTGAYNIYVERKKHVQNNIWVIKPKELKFAEPKPEIVGRGTFGLVLLAEYRGTKVAVKRVIPPRSKRKGGKKQQQQQQQQQQDGDVSKVDEDNSIVAAVNNNGGDGVNGNGGVLSSFDTQNTLTSSIRTITQSGEVITATASSSSGEGGGGGGGGGADEEMGGGCGQSQPAVTFDDTTTAAMNEETTGRSGTNSGRGTNNNDDAFMYHQSWTMASHSHYSDGGSSGSDGYFTKSSKRLFAMLVSSRRKKTFFRQRDKYAESKTDFIREMMHLSKLRHPCITTVMGAVIDKSVEPMLVMEFCDHGSLYDLLRNESMPLDGDILLPILGDICQGIRFLHSANPQIVHGDLKAANILVDSRFRAKVSDFGFSAKARSMGATGTPLWMAPELLRNESNSTAASDVYSFGIILYELYSRKDPYEGEDQQDLLSQIADPKLNRRPPVPKACPSRIETIMKECVDGIPEARPTFDELDLRLKRLTPDSLTPQDSVLAAYNKRKRENKAENLLQDVFPPHIVEALREGRKVEKEHHECVTIFFSDIVGFTTISARLGPEKVAEMLDRLYSKLDALTTKHEIFKIETIGDAYMAITNLVKDQSSDHVKRVAAFSMDAIEACKTVLIDEQDPAQGTVQIRVGFHSGPVLSGVVGTRLPKYGVFGDTVNTASRMESNSSAMKIHCSKASAVLLKKQAPEIPLKSRGRIQIKGKEKMATYWVNGAGVIEKGRRSDDPLKGGSEHSVDLDLDLSQHDAIPETSSETSIEVVSLSALARQAKQSGMKLDDFPNTYGARSLAELLSRGSSTDGEEDVKDDDSMDTFMRSLQNESDRAEIEKLRREVAARFGVRIDCNVNIGKVDNGVLRKGLDRRWKSCQDVEPKGSIGYA